jgi:hypothetical protein
MNDFPVFTVKSLFDAGSHGIKHVRHEQSFDEFLSFEAQRYSNDERVLKPKILSER